MTARMHQTTVRCGADIWASLEAEAERLGVSVAHYVRDAALARLAYTEGFNRASAELAVGWAQGEATVPERAASGLVGAEAARAQDRLARARSKTLRDEAAIRRELPTCRS